MELETFELTDFCTGASIMNNSINYAGFIDLVKKDHAQELALIETIDTAKTVSLTPQATKTSPVTTNRPPEQTSDTFNWAGTVCKT